MKGDTERVFPASILLNMVLEYLETPALLRYVPQILSSKLLRSSVGINDFPPSLVREKITLFFSKSEGRRTTFNPFFNIQTVEP